jgi:malonyl-CoA O-methyltransferase
MKGFFVTGTDTGVGKTIASAILVRKYDAVYWKPVQTGAKYGDDDTDIVRKLALRDATQIVPPRHVFQAPLSPQAAAELENVNISIDDFMYPDTAGRTLIVEGAGGVLVPIGKDATMADLIIKFALPVILVARTTLGTINHSLLSIASLRARGITIAGILFNGEDAPQTMRLIKNHGNAPILGRIPPITPVTAEQIARTASLID